MRALALLCLAACGGPSVSGTPPATQPVEALVRDVKLREGTVRLVVRFDRGRGAWGRYVLDRAARFLPAAERWLDVPFHRAAAPMLAGSWTVTIEGRERVTLAGRWIGAYNNSSGFFGGPRGIFVEYGLTEHGDPALVFHELAHFWFHDTATVVKHETEVAGIPWFDEGVASLLPLLLADGGELSLEDEERVAIGRHWGLGEEPPVDPPVVDDVRPKGGAYLRAFYLKTFAALLIIRRELGDDKLRRVLTGAARKLPRDDNELLLRLAAERPADWRALLAGWVYPGTRKR